MSAHYYVQEKTIEQKINNPVYFVVIGKVFNSKIKFAFKIQPPKRVEVITSLVAINMSTNTELFATGSSLKPVIHESILKKSTVCPTIQQNLLYGGCPGGSTLVDFHTEWFDPIDIIVNSVDTYTNCSWNYSRVYACSGSDSYSMDQTTGWGLASHSFNWYYGSGYSFAKAQSYFHFSDPNFPACFGNSTDTFYSPNWSQVSAGGTYTGGVTTWVSSKSIQCVWLLHYDTYIYGG